MSLFLRSRVTKITRFKNKPGKLRLSANYRNLEYNDSPPFVYPGDTARELFPPLNSEEPQYFLNNPTVKGFTVIRIVSLSELGRTSILNSYRYLLLVDRNPSISNKNVDILYAGS